MKNLFVIEIETLLEAPLEICFNITRNSKDITDSIPPLKNAVIDSTLVNHVALGDRFYIDFSYFKDTLSFTTKYNVIEFVPPLKFSEELTSKIFKEFKYTHEFKQSGNQTLMVDRIEYKMSFGILGKKLNEKFMDEFLRQFVRNRIVRIQKKVENAKIKK